MQHMNRIFLAAASATASLVLALIGSHSAAWADSGNTSLAATALAQMPVIDGHNDLAWEIRDRFASNIDAVDLKKNTALLPRAANAPGDQAPLMTDIPRLRAGGVGAQFWSVWVPTESKDATAVQLTLEQIDLVKRMVAHYPGDFEMAYTAADIVRIEHAHRIASLIGVEGGHQINNSLATLRRPPHPDVNAQ
jgi:membrane dipeptidase